MKNSTLWGLTLAGIRLPFITLPMSTRSCEHVFRNIRFSKSTTSFLLDHSINSYISLQKSYFSEVFSSPIRLETTDANLFSQVITQKRSFENVNTLIVEETYFLQCESPTNNGGAILINKRLLSAKFDKCSFQYCSTKMAGGAIYGILNNMSIYRTCFEGCQALESGHAYFIKHTDPRSRSVFSEISILQCSLTNSGRAAGMIYVGNYHLQFNNVTRSNAFAMGAAITAFNCKNITLTFSEISNSSSFHILRITGLCGFSLMMFDNILGNIAEKSIIASSGGNNIAHCVFSYNYAPEFITGYLSFLQFAYCVIDKNYTFDEINFVRTPYLSVKENPEPNPLRFAFGGICRILSDSEGLGVDDIANELFDSVPQRNGQFVRLFRKKAYRPFNSNHTINFRKLRTNRQEKVIIKKPTVDYQDEPEPTPPMIEIGIGMEAVRLTPRPITPRRVSIPQPTPRRRNTPNLTPSMQFSPSNLFHQTSTFLPSLQFTAPNAAKPNVVPYVLYSTAGFVIVAVMTTFLFLKGSDSGYNLVAPSESAESKISDYASSTSTTVTITGESSSTV